MFDDKSLIGLLVLAVSLSLSYSLSLCLSFIRFCIFLLHFDAQTRSQPQSVLAHTLYDYDNRQTNAHTQAHTHKHAHTHSHTLVHHIVTVFMVFVHLFLISLTLVTFEVFGFGFSLVRFFLQLPFGLVPVIKSALIYVALVLNYHTHTHTYLKICSYSSSSSISLLTCHTHTHSQLTELIIIIET